MALSSSSLFHYTKGGLDILKKIISTGFKVTYNEELNPTDIANEAMFETHSSVTTPIHKAGHGKTHPLSNWLYIPMVSFCDIPISSISKHVQYYGFSQEDKRGNVQKIGYAIGLTKSWGKQMNLNPLLYVVNCNRFSKRLRSAYISNPNTMGPISENYLYMEPYYPPKPMGEGFMIEDNKGNLFPLDYLYIKPLSSEIIIPGYGEQIENYQDEKEWRYIPDNACIISGKKWENIGHYQRYYYSVNENVKKAIDEASKDLPMLEFSPFDITHIIVGKEEEIPEIQRHLAETYSNLAGDSLNLVFSKVTSYERLVQDTFGN